MSDIYKQSGAIQTVSMSSSENQDISEICKTHIGHKLTLICYLHDQIVCDLCAAMSHSKCGSVTSIEDDSFNYRRSSKLNILKEQIEQISHELENNLSDCKKGLSGLENNKGKIRETIISIREKMIVELKKVEENLIRDLEMKYVKCKIELLKSKKEMVSKSNTLHIWKNDIEALTETSDYIKQFQVFKYLEHRVKNESKDMEKLTCSTRVPGLQFQKAKQGKEVKLFCSFGSIYLTENYLSQRISYFLNKYIYFPGPSHGDKRLSVTSLDTSLLGDVSVHRGYVDWKGQLYFINGCNRHELIACKNDGTDYKTMKLKSAGNAVARYKHDYNDCLVATNDGIVVVNQKRWTIIGQMLTGVICRFIVSNNSDIIISTDGRTIIRLDITGAVLSKFTTFFKVRDIDIDQNGCIYYIDYLSENIHAIKDNGNERVVFSSPDLKGSTSLAVNREDYIYISGSRDASNIIYRISVEGKTKDVAITTHMFGAKKLSLTGDELLVIDQTSQLIQIHVVKS